MSKKVFTFQNSLGALILSAATAVVLFAVCGDDSNSGGSSGGGGDDPPAVTNPWDNMSCNATGTCVPITSEAAWNACPANNRFPSATCTGTSTCSQNVDCPGDQGYCNGGCTLTTRANCTGSFSTTRPAACDQQPTGSCTVGGVCTNGVTNANCAGTWVAGGTCTTTPPPPPPPPTGECDEAGSLGYCCFPGECYPMGPEQAEFSTTPIVSTEQCTSQEGRVSAVCNPSTVIGYCGWEAGVAHCDPIGDTDMNPDNPGMTQQQACATFTNRYFAIAQYANAEAALAACVAATSIAQDNYCDYGFGNIVASPTCDQYAAPTTGPNTDSPSGFYCDFGPSTVYGTGGCFFRPNVAASNRPGSRPSGDTNTSDRCDWWAAEVSRTACEASNQANGCISAGVVAAGDPDGNPGAPCYQNPGANSCKVTPGTGDCLACGPPATCPW